MSCRRLPKIRPFTPLMLRSGMGEFQVARTGGIWVAAGESCKLNRINPRLYFKKLVDDLHAGKPAYTPAEFAALLSQDAESRRFTHSRRASLNHPRPSLGLQGRPASGGGPEALAGSL